MEDICRITAEARIAPFLGSIEGDALARIVCATSGSIPLGGSVRSALDKAFAALGWPPERFVALSSSGLEGDRLRLCLESIDPLIIVALDTVAGASVAGAYGSSAPVPGVPFQLPSGSPLVVVDGFIEALGSVETKRAVWHQLRAAAPTPPLQ